MTPALQDRFDGLLEDAIESLPEQFRAALEEIPVIVVDRPDAALVAELRRAGTLPPAGDEEGPADLLGLHSGIAITEQSVQHSGTLPPTIHVFREALVEFAGGWAQAHPDEEIYEEIRVTLLHELGHHFGLDEGDLESLGYG